MGPMTLDFDACYEAIKTRDARFDGRFFTAVKSTGIYCRPICPARTPGRAKVSFFPFAAAAEEAGFRACRRCRPDRSPDSPDWDWRGDLIGRALRLISSGMADADGIPGVADRLGVSERHLRRLFVTELGAAPGAVARTHRNQLARRLIEESSMSLSDVAHAAGFASIRRFNQSIREAFGRTPSELRTASGTRSRSGCTLRLPYRKPLDTDHLFAYLAGRATPGVEEVDGNIYRRTVSLGDARGIVTIELIDDEIILDARLDDVSGLASVVRRARHMLDLDADPAAIATHLQRDPKLRRTIGRFPGLRVPGAFDGFELAVRAILGQQVSVKAATTLAGRLATTFGEPLEEPEGRLTHYFPRPEVLVDAPIESIGLPTKRAATVRVLSEAVAGGEITLDGTADDEEVKARLLELPGFGPWTVSYIAMRALRDPNAFPASDLGIKHAFENLKITDKNRAERWSPWGAYATMYLWAGLTTG
jgi:AraC family transcriptional regulator, regulatory protein of adaptative response / DNA-3-methyladenine glycosylase II